MLREDCTDVDQHPQLMILADLSKEIKAVEAKLQEWQPTSASSSSSSFLPTITNAQGQPIPIRLDAIEFELRHTREHLEKLKFNLLELATKQTFLDQLLQPDQWQAMLAGHQWTPSDVRALETGEIGPAKGELKACKTRMVEVEMEIQLVCDQVTRIQDTVECKWTEAGNLLGQLYSLRHAIGVILEDGKIPLGQSLEELDAIIADLEVQVAKKRTTLEQQTARNAELERILQGHMAEIARLRVVEAEASGKAERIQKARKKQSAETAQLGQLCQWYSSMIELIQGLSGVRVEMIRPDYLLVTCSGGAVVVPVHLMVDPKTGRLQSVQIGSTSNTPKRQWRQIIDTAVETNDIVSLIRQVSGGLRSMIQ